MSDTAGDEHAAAMSNLDQTLRLELHQCFPHRRGRNAELSRHRQNRRKLITRTELPVFNRRTNPMHQQVRQPLAYDGHERGRCPHEYSLNLPATPAPPGHSRPDAPESNSPTTPPASWIPARRAGIQLADNTASARSTTMPPRVTGSAAGTS